MDVNEFIKQVEGFWLQSSGDKNFENDVSSDILYMMNEAKKLAHREHERESSLKLCDASLEALWEQLNVGHWSDVSPGLRQAYAHVSLLKCLLLLYRSRDLGEEQQVKDVEAALSACDMGLLLGAPHSSLIQAAQILNSALNTGESSEGYDEEEPSAEVLREDDLPPAESVEVKKCPSLETFYTQHFSPKKPVMLTDCIEHWPARTQWTIPYLKKIAGGRTVPVELGVHYADENWSQELMTLQNFIEVHMQSKQASDVPNDTPVGYLAQHPLFDQVPELKDDIRVPEYCCLQEENNEEEEENDDNGPDINAWIGPAGTLSPLHYDPKHNILSQVKGYKRVWLFSPEDSEKLYPHESETLLSNTAQVDPENPDLTKFPAYSQARAWRCLLRPGYCLYIPPRWWHHIRALTPSISVSFWWK